MVVLLAVYVLAGPKSLLDFSIEQWRAMPEVRIEDAYKWLFHATLGGEHAVTDDEGPRQWLDGEWPTVGKPMPGEPEIVELRPDGKLIRVNLRPFKARGGSKEGVLKVFVASAKAFKADKKSFILEWNALGLRLKSHGIGRMRFRDWHKLDKETKPLGYPAIDHSEGYEKAYKPAYRVMLRALWDR